MRGLAEQLPASMLASSDGELTTLMELFAENNEVVIIDALDLQNDNHEAGMILQLNPAVDRLEDTGLRSSTHAMGIAEAIEMARTLGDLPERLRVIGIVGRDFSNREGLSPEVRQAADQVTRDLIEEFDDA